MNLDALLEPAENQIQPCKLGRVIQSLPEPYKSALINLLDITYANGGESDASIRTRLFKAGHPVSQPVIYRHRNNQCSCVGAE